MPLRGKRKLVKSVPANNCSYISAMVLGLNDALVELTGALAGFTMALQDNNLIILAGLTTGIAATLSMAASEFLSQETDDNRLSPGKAALYTGITYFVTVVLLLLPYVIFDRPMHALAACMFTAAFIIMVFALYVSKIRHTSFIHDFLQMLAISMGVAAIAFGISWLARMWWGINV